jgi:hypothetical protein
LALAYIAILKGKVAMNITTDMNDQIKSALEDLLLTDFDDQSLRLDVLRRASSLALIGSDDDLVGAVTAVL